MVHHPFNWNKLSICSAIVYRWDGRRCRLYFRIISGSNPGMVWTAFAPQSAHAAVFETPAAAVGGRSASGIRARDESGREFMGEHSGQ